MSRPSARFEVWQAVVGCRDEDRILTQPFRQAGSDAVEAIALPGSDHVEHSAIVADQQQRGHGHQVIGAEAR